MHLAKLLKGAGGVPGYGNVRSAWDAAPGSTSRTRSTEPDRAPGAFPYLRDTSAKDDVTDW